MRTIIYALFGLGAPSTLAWALTFVVVGVASFFVTRVWGKPKGIARMALVVAAGFGSGAMAARRYANSPFDSVAWRAEGSDRSHWPFAHSPRERMIDDLVENVLPGSTIDQVRARLGPPSASSGNDALMYVIGPHPIIDNVLLVLHFKEGRYERFSWGND